MPQQHLIEQVASVFHGFKSALGKQFEERAIPMAPTHLKVLRTIHRHQPCTGQDIARLLNRDKAQVNRLLQDFFSQALVERVPNPSDKRSQLLEITAAGAERLQLMEQAEQTVIAQLTHGLSPQEQRELKRMLTVMQANV